MVYPSKFHVLSFISSSDFDPTSGPPESGTMDPDTRKMEDAIREARLEMAREIANRQAEAIGECPVCLEPILDPPIHQVISLTNFNL